MTINIDDKSGFCFGVVNTIGKAEEELANSGKLYCLGNIVHNNAEVERLQKKGLVTINYKEFGELKNCKVLIRAHGEPPETYETARKNNIELIDASCKVVLKLQSRIRENSLGSDDEEQIVIFGKDGHAEVNGLVGQTKGRAIVVKQISDLDKIDFSKPVTLFSQTTMDIDNFAVISDEIRSRMQNGFGIVEIPFTINDTICRQVANRAPHLRQFAADNDIIIFASGKDSSNGKVLYEVCKKINEKSYFVTGISDIDNSWFSNANSVGICGATSTPRWLMEEISKFIKSIPI
jgi:4-hydroxy-3-methylbut-2-enyl diphosphate reductase